MPEKEWDFLPFHNERAQEADVFLMTFFFPGCVWTLTFTGHLPKNEFVRDRLTPSLIEWQPGSAQKLMEVNAVQQAECDDLLDVPWWRRERFVIRKRTGRREILLVREYARDPAADGRSLSERKAHTRT